MASVHAALYAYLRICRLDLDTGPSLGPTHFCCFANPGYAFLGTLPRKKNLAFAASFIGGIYRLIGRSVIRIS